MMPAYSASFGRSALLAKYRFSSLVDGDAVPFDPDSDTFLFDSWFLTPGAVSVLSRSASVVLFAENRRVTLIGVTIDQLNPGNMRFAGYDMSDATLAAAGVGAD